MICSLDIQITSTGITFHFYDDRGFRQGYLSFRIESKKWMNENARYIKPSAAARKIRTVKKRALRKYWFRGEVPPSCPRSCSCHRRDMTVPRKSCKISIIHVCVNSSVPNGKHIRYLFSEITNTCDPKQNYRIIENHKGFIYFCTVRKSWFAHTHRPITASAALRKIKRYKRWTRRNSMCPANGYCGCHTTSN